MNPAIALIPFLLAHAEPGHPVISEVLASVPSDRSDPLVGDANLDNVRHAVGDEFVELYNPHGVAIDLRGYTIVDGHPEAESARWSFTFPSFRLDPGETVVVFNGLEQAWPMVPGDARAAPRQRHPQLGWVFTTRNRSSRRGLANAGDWVQLQSPKGQPLEAIVWGEPTVPVPASIPTVFEAPTVRGGSVVRTGEAFDVHPTVDEPTRPARSPGTAEPEPARGVPYSPGTHTPAD